jgi:2'-5' RNA ligase
MSHGAAAFVIRHSTFFRHSAFVIEPWERPQMPIRSFIAIEVPSDLQEAMGRIQGKLIDTRVQVRWVKVENIHLTIKFLGDVRDEDIPKVCDIMKDAAAGASPFELELAGLGTFPPNGIPRVVWVGMRGDLDALNVLVEELEENLSEELGIAAEHREFKPHLTIGRVKTTKGADRLVQAMKALEPAELGRFIADGITLFMSELGSEGSTYTRMAEMPFAKA